MLYCTAYLGRVEIYLYGVLFWFVYLCFVTLTVIYMKRAPERGRTNGMEVELPFVDAIFSYFHNSSFILFSILSKGFSSNAIYLLLSIYCFATFAASNSLLKG